MISSIAIACLPLKLPANKSGSVALMVPTEREPFTGGMSAYTYGMHLE